jgi:hypothetical protein
MESGWRSNAGNRRNTPGEVDRLGGRPVAQERPVRPDVLRDILRPRGAQSFAVLLPRGRDVLPEGGLRASVHGAKVPHQILFAEAPRTDSKLAGVADVRDGAAEVAQRGEPPQALHVRHVVVVPDLVAEEPAFGAHRADVAGALLGVLPDALPVRSLEPAAEVLPPARSGHQLDGQP